MFFVNETDDESRYCINDWTVSVRQSEELYRSFFHFNEAVSYKASDFSSFHGNVAHLKNDVEMFNKLVSLNFI